VAVLHLLARYWDWAGSNVGAMPACGLVALTAGLIFRKPLARLWHRVHAAILAPIHARLDGIAATAAAAHRIAADTHKALTGFEHPDAPKAERKTGGTRL
jgi:hypothetical protein